MPAILDVESTLTDRYQTTIPETVRRALNLDKRDKIHYAIRPSGEVILTRANTAEDDDPVIGHFLDYLATDMTRHPERLVSFDDQLVQRLKGLTEGIDPDLDAPLSEDGE